MKHGVEYQASTHPILQNLGFMSQVRVESENCGFFLAIGISLIESMNRIRSTDAFPRLLSKFEGDLEFIRKVFGPNIQNCKRILEGLKDLAMPTQEFQRCLLGEVSNDNSGAETSENLDEIMRLIIGTYSENCQKEILHRSISTIPGELENLTERFLNDFGVYLLVFTQEGNFLYPKKQGKRPLVILYFDNDCYYIPYHSSFSIGNDLTKYPYFYEPESNVVDQFIELIYQLKESVDFAQVKNIEEVKSVIQHYKKYLPAWNSEISEILTFVERDTGMSACDECGNLVQECTTVKCQDHFLCNECRCVAENTCLMCGRNYSPQENAVLLATVKSLEPSKQRFLCTRCEKIRPLCMLHKCIEEVCKQCIEDALYCRNCNKAAFYCAVCRKGILQDMTPHKCGHVFHKKCKKDRCPVCS